MKWWRYRACRKFKAVTSTINGHLTRLSPTSRLLFLAVMLVTLSCWRRKVWYKYMMMATKLQSWQHPKLLTNRFRLQHQAATSMWPALSPYQSDRPKTTLFNKTVKYNAMTATWNEVQSLGPPLSILFSHSWSNLMIKYTVLLLSKHCI